MRRSIRKYITVSFLVTFTLGLLGASRTTYAQSSGPSYRVGVLRSHMRDQQSFRAFLDTLRQLGYEEGRNLQLLERIANNQLDNLPALAAELVAAHVDVIVAVNTPGSQAAIAATQMVPIVLAIVGDPVASGFVSSLTRPGGNVTGQSIIPRGVTMKRLELLKEVVPTAQRIALLFNPNNAITLPQIQEADRAAPSLGIAVRSFPARTSAEATPV
jgi:putative ABC transport system substrate-binding protein